MEKITLETEFKDQFNQAPEKTFFAPGRINLIGEHTDYNGGHVFPAAISLGTYAAVSKNADKKLHLYSVNYPEIGEIVIDLTDLNYKESDSWTNYVKGMFHEIFGDQDIPFGLNILVHGDLPSASGLSSSASMEMLVGVIINSMYDLKINQLDLVKMGQRVENNYIGVNSGIMDQFAVGMGQKDHAIFLDANTLDYQLFPLNLGDHSIVIMNTKKPRNLIEGKYNERRAECEQALHLLQEHIKINALGELTPAIFDQYTFAINDETLIKRARHAVSENERTIKAQQAMINSDLDEFGRLMNASHVSLEFDYEVTGIELDTLVHTTWNVPGVLGARMTGAGFGGCAIALVENDAIDNLINEVSAKYQTMTDFTPEFYVTKIGSGPTEI